MLENFITQVGHPKGVSSEREAFVSRAAACIYKRQNIYVCMYVCPHISSEITEPNSTKFCMPPQSYHGTLNKKYLTDRSIFAKDILIF